MADLQTTRYVRRSVSLDWAPDKYFQMRLVFRNALLQHFTIRWNQVLNIKNQSPRERNTQATVLLTK